jgi:hypothetical protein
LPDRYTYFALVFDRGRHLPPGKLFEHADRVTSRQPSRARHVDDDDWTFRCCSSSR